MAKFLVGGVVVEGAEALLDPIIAALYPYDDLDEFFALAPLQQDPPLESDRVRHPPARARGMAGGEVRRLSRRAGRWLAGGGVAAARR